MSETRRTPRALAVVLAGFVLLSGCGSDEPKASEASDADTQPETSIKQGAIRLTAPANEDEVARKSGKGGNTKVQLKKGGLVYVYIVCDGASPVTVSVDAVTRDDDVRATCDKLVEKSEFPTDRDEPLTVQITAAESVTWQALVTRS